jgi:lycopene cyclase domain-containing protein
MDSFMSIWNNYPYLRWHLVFVIIPSIILWVFYWRYLVKYKKTILAITALSFIWGLIFNLVASTTLHVWYYQNTIGISFLGLPLEEYIFLLLVPQELCAILLLCYKKLYD